MLSATQRLSAPSGRVVCVGPCLSLGVLLLSTRDGPAAGEPRAVGRMPRRWGPWMGPPAAGGWGSPLWGAGGAKTVAPGMDAWGVRLTLHRWALANSQPARVCFFPGVHQPHDFHRPHDPPYSVSTHPAHQPHDLHLGQPYPFEYPNGSRIERLTRTPAPTRSCAGQRPIAIRARCSIVVGWSMYGTVFMPGLAGRGG
jgi:hypothetical protein